MGDPVDGEAWLASIEQEIQAFARQHRFAYAKSKRHIAGSFEIGCFLALASFYERKGKVTPKNLKDGTFRYLTTPQGRPENFSYLSMELPEGEFELRQQMRVASHVGDDVFFTPDMVVLPSGAEVTETHDPDYANGRQWFDYVRADQIVAVHECKSLNPFPELFVSFVGMFVCAHDWFQSPLPGRWEPGKGSHLAPALFVGGTPSDLHTRMVRGLQDAYPINIIVGLHKGTWDLRGQWKTLSVIKDP